jgi:hypothetical protein
MSLRRCPSCHNLVERESETCPICGRSFLQAVILRITPWMMIAVLVIWSIHHFRAGVHH